MPYFTLCTGCGLVYDNEVDESRHFGCVSGISGDFYGQCEHCEAIEDGMRHCPDGTQEHRDAGKCISELSRRASNAEFFEAHVGPQLTELKETVDACLVGRKAAHSSQKEKDDDD